MDLLASINRQVGRPWGPGFDCWAFVRTVYHEVYGIALGPLPYGSPEDVTETLPATADELASGRWVPSDPPRSGDVVAMGKRAYPHHCGLWIDAPGGPRIAHNLGRLGVVVTTPAALRGSGWATIRTVRHRDLIGTP